MRKALKGTREALGHKVVPAVKALKERKGTRAHKVLKGIKELQDHKEIKARKEIKVHRGIKDLHTLEDTVFTARMTTLIWTAQPLLRE